METQLPIQQPIPLDTDVLQKLIRDEVDRSNQYLSFAQGQARADREYFKNLLDRFLWVIGSIFLVAGTITGVLGFRSFEQLKEEITAVTKTEMPKAQTESKRELDNVRVEVQKRVKSEFRSENITTLVQKTAQERMGKEVNSIIHSEAVDAAIKATQNQFHNLLEGPVQHEFERAARLNDLHEVILTAKSGNRKAFDYLISESSFAHPYYEIAESTAREILRELGNHAARPFLQRKSPEELTKLLISSRDPAERMMAIDSFYPPDDPSIVPALIDVIYNDDNLQVVLVALRSFNTRCRSNYHYAEYLQVKDCWQRDGEAILQAWRQNNKQR